VFGFGIYAEPNVPDEKILHTAAIFAELMDNDEDGTADNPTVLAELVMVDGLMPVFEYDGSPGMNTFMNNYQGDGASAVLWASEIHPEGTTQQNGFDATLEEVMHTIHHIGYGNAYPSAFGDSPGTDLTNAMDVARGGQFFTIPNPYPDSAWYHYDDFTCDYACMAIEYIYWANSSLMGAQNFPWRCADIDNEWELCHPDSFQVTDVAMYALLTNTIYTFPQLEPDGNYCPSATGHNEIETVGSVSIFPNPTTGVINLEKSFMHPQKVVVSDVQGKTVLSELMRKNSIKLNLGKLESGVYYLRIGSYLNKVVKL